MAGRALQPVHRITDAARRLSEQTLHSRINLKGPDDELKELADTFDAMLARLDRAFTSQRRFVANASHELRTPLATERVLIDEALANRSARPEDFRAILEDLRANSEETERLVDALLVLARSERGIERWSDVDLAAAAEAALAVAAPEAARKGVQVRSDLTPVTVKGDPGLLERLIGNVVENGIRHNFAGGWVNIAVHPYRAQRVPRGHQQRPHSRRRHRRHPDRTVPPRRPGPNQRRRRVRAGTLRRGQHHQRPLRFNDPTSPARRRTRAPSQTASRHQPDRRCQQNGSKAGPSAGQPTQICQATRPPATGGRPSLRPFPK